MTLQSDPLAWSCFRPAHRSTTTGDGPTALFEGQ